MTERARSTAGESRRRRRLAGQRWCRAGEGGASRRAARDRCRRTDRRTDRLPDRRPDRPSDPPGGHQRARRDLRRRRGERGAATAELAMALPLLVAVTVGLVWLLAVGAAQVRAVDAARETARAVARGDSVAEAVARGRQVAPPGAAVSVRDGDRQVTAVVVGRVSGPGGLFGRLPAVTVSAEAVAVAEESAPAAGARP